MNRRYKGSKYLLLKEKQKPNYSKRNKKNILIYKYKNQFSRKNKSKIKCKYNCIFIFIIFSIIVIGIKFIFFRNKKTSSLIKMFERKPDKSDIYFEEKFPNLTESFNNAKEFLDKCLKGILINNQTVKPSENPKVSAVIPCYNCIKTLGRAIKSIQNQNITDFEIIIVNDNSLNETLTFVEKLQKEDQRIKIVNNRKNMGILYSRSIGALSGKGKYIFPLDQDDMLLDKDIYSTITNIAEKGGFDLVGYRIIFSTFGLNILQSHISEYYFSDHVNNKVLYQPELGLYPLRPGKSFDNYDIKDVFLWNKCIKTNVYQTALNKVGEKRYSRYMLAHEDVVATCFLFNTAESMKYIGKYGILHKYTGGSASFRRFPEKDWNRFNLYLTDIAIDFTKDTFDSRRLLVYLIISILEKKTLKETLQENENNKELFNSCLNKILNMKYISNEDKEEIRKRVSKLDFVKEKTF